jgi:N-acetylglucosamine-6-phosphate deacetylase
MHGAVTNSINDINIALEHASIMASVTPARFTKIHDRVGEIEVGKRANFLVINNDNTLLEVWQNGSKRHCAN